MQISRNIVNGPKSNNYLLVGIRAMICGQEPSHHFLQTLHSLRMSKSVFRDSSLYPKQLSLFSLLRLFSASADHNGYISNLCSMTELLHERTTFFNMEAFRNLIMSQQAKRKITSLLDFHT